MDYQASHDLEDFVAITQTAMANVFTRQHTHQVESPTEQPPRAGTEPTDSVSTEVAPVPIMVESHDGSELALPRRIRWCKITEVWMPRRCGSSAKRCDLEHAYVPLLSQLHKNHTKVA